MENQEGILSFNDVKEVFEEFFGEDRVEAVNDNIIVYFPKVTVTNEHNQSTEITKLFVKQGVNSCGESSGVFTMLRTEYTESQAISGYSHSHLPHVHNWPIPFNTPCLGSGPLVTTVATLTVNPSIELWQLFCVELSKYVETESVAGTPYNYIRNIGKRSSQRYSWVTYNPRDNSRFNYIIESFVDHIIKTKGIDFDYYNGYIVGMSDKYKIITFSNLFLEWVNQLPSEIYEECKEEIDCIIVKGRYAYNTVECLDGNIRTSGLFANKGRYILTFKGVDYKLNIIEEERDTEEVLNIIVSNVLNRIIYLLTSKINYEYGINKGHFSQATVNKVVRYF